MKTVDFKASQIGFGLIELMIAIALGAILMLGVTEIVTRNSATRNEMERTAELIESGVFAVNLLSSEVRSAGYWGEGGAQPDPNDPNTPAAILAGTAADETAALEELQEALAYPIQGGVEGDSQIDSLYTLKGDSDFLVIRRARSCRAGTGAGTCGDPIDDDRVYLQANACADDPPELRLDTGDDDLTLETRVCDPAVPAPIYRLLVRVYFVDDTDQLRVAELNETGAGALSGAQTLVEGVEMFRVTYGIDTDNDGEAEEYKAQPDADEWGLIAAVKLSLLVRAPTASPGFNDQRVYLVEGVEYAVDEDFVDHRRQIFSSAIPALNIAPRGG